jgi:hypothetical protein
LKAQFATLEALLSLTVVLSTASVAGGIIANSERSVGYERAGISRASAAYDFMMQLALNSSASECLSRFESEGSDCLNNYTQYYRYVYGIRQMGVIVPNASGYNYSEVYCSNGTSGLLCVGVS